jgi:hypothetical protein
VPKGTVLSSCERSASVNLIKGQLPNAARFTYQLIKNKQTEDKFNKYLVDEEKDWIKKAGEKEATIAIEEGKLFLKLMTGLSFHYSTKGLSKL